MTKWKDCNHKWLLSITQNAPYVYCPECEASFKPVNQQLPYKGMIPDKYKT